MSRLSTVGLFGLLLLLVAGAGCSGDSSGGTSTGSSHTQVELGGVENVTLKVISFNVLYGAGYDRRFDANIPERFRNRDKLPELVHFLELANPDIVAFQETGGWDAGNPSVADQIAEHLGMNYVMAHDAWELHVMVFSKFPIHSAEYVSRDQGFNGVLLLVTLAVSPTASVNVVAVHLNSMSSQTRACQLDVLLELTSRLSGRTIVLGDMNFRPSSPPGEQLTSQGWQLVAAQETWPIDQIWLDPEAAFSSGAWWSKQWAPGGISDHEPIGADITFSLPRRLLELPPPDSRIDPRPLEYACE